MKRGIVALILTAGVVLAVVILKMKSESTLPNRGVLSGSDASRSETRLIVSGKATGEERAGAKKAEQSTTQPAVSWQGARLRISLAASLLPSPGSPLNPDEFQARFGIGMVAPEDAREREAWLREGDRSAGAETTGELVNIRAWRPVTISSAANGTIRLGPENVPEAPMYRILAWDTDRNYYWHTVTRATDSKTTAVDAGMISPGVPTGIRLRVVGKLPEYPAILQRIPGANAEKAGPFVPVIQHVAPEIADALLEETDVILSTEEPNRLYPLPPDEAIRIILLSPTGEESRAQEYRLEEGKVLEAELDADSLFAAGTFDTLTLRGKLLVEGTEEPVVSAGIALHEGDPPETVTDADGQFEVELPMLHPTILSVSPVPTSGTRPLLRQQYGLEFSPEGLTTGSVVERNFRLKPYLWLGLDLTGKAATDLASHSALPYPIYVLQRHDSQKSTWSVAPADHFLPTGSSVVISVTDPGRYRVLAAASPVTVWASAPAEVTGKEGDTTVTLEPKDMGEFEVEVVDAATSTPLVDVDVYVADGDGAFPPLRGVTNVTGVWKLPVVAAGSAIITAKALGYVPTERTVALSDRKVTIPLRRGEGAE